MVAKKTKSVKKAGDKAGHYAFIAGVLLAILVGLFPQAIENENVQSAVVLVLVLLGLIVGFLNITGGETSEFLIASIALMGGSGIVTLGLIPTVGPYIQAILTNIALFVAPAALVVALKAIKSLAER